MNRGWFVGFSNGEDYGDYEGFSIVEDDNDGGMYYPLAMSQYIEEEAIYHEGDAEISLALDGAVEEQWTRMKVLSEVEQLSKLGLEAVAEASASTKILKQIFSAGYGEVKVVISPDRLSVIAKYDGDTLELSTRAITTGVEGIEYGYFDGRLLYRLINTIPDNATIWIRLYEEEPHYRVLEIKAHTGFGEIGHIIAPRLPDNEW